jgi:hypothetical protein
MKNRITYSVITAVVTISLLLSNPSRAQVVLYGLTSAGGTATWGTVFSVTPSGTIDVIANLNLSVAALPMGSLLYASDGNFYASTNEGGYDDSCTIFRCTPNGTLTTIINLDTV